MALLYGSRFFELVHSDFKTSRAKAMTDIFRLVIDIRCRDIGPAARADFGTAAIAAFGYDAIAPVWCPAVSGSIDALNL